MKRSVRILALTLVVVLFAFALFSCRKFSGTYTNYDLRISYTFSGRNQVSITRDKKTVTGTYRIKDNVLTLTLSTDDNTDAVLALLDGDHTFEDRGNSVLIDDISYTKA